MKILKKIKSLILFIINFRDFMDEIKVNQGIILSRINENKVLNNIQDYEFKIFSQDGEDGIIQHLLNCLEIKNKTFIEFGVEDFTESNCRFLLIKDKWSGFVIDGSEKNINKLKNYNFYWKNNLTAIHCMLNKENIEEILKTSNFDQDLGIMSIDLDGNDYYILNEINYYKPRILICEYNSLFGDTKKVSVPYRSDFFMTKAHYSNQFWGASLAALNHLAQLKGYELVGTSSSGINAFFVRKDLINDKIKILSVKSAFTKSRHQNSRDKNYNLNFLNYHKREEIIKGKKVYEVEKENEEIF